jgi:hypothetical protein
MEFTPCVLVAQGSLCMRPIAHTRSTPSLKREDKNVFGNFLSLSVMQRPEIVVTAVIVTGVVRNNYFLYQTKQFVLGKGKGLPKQVKVAQAIPGRFRPRIFLPLGTTTVVGRQLYAPAAFTPGEISGTHF